VPFPPDHFLHQLLIEILRTNIRNTRKTQLEILLEEEVVGGRALVLYVVLQVSPRLHRSKTETLHHCHYLIVNRNLIETDIDPERIHLSKSDEPRMLANL